MRFGDTAACGMRIFSGKAGRDLRARNFVHHCTDGPECPAAYAFSRKEAGQLFAKFADVRMTVAHFPLRRYRIGQLIPFGLEKWLAFNIGWYLFIDAAKPVPT